MTAVKVGQVWRDKDKRRNTVIEIIELNVDSGGQPTFYVTGLIVGTEEVRTYNVDRLVKRWGLIKEASNELTLAEATEAARDKGAKLTIHLSEGDKAVLVPERLRKKQPAYMLKMVSPHNPDYKLRITQKMLDEYGAPVDPWGSRMELAD